MMKITEALKARRSYYAINRELPVAIDRVMDMVKELTELVPDAFNMKSSRVARISSGTKSMTFLKERLPEKKLTASVRAAAPFSISTTGK